MKRDRTVLSLGDKVSDVMINILMGIIVIVVLYPFINIIAISLSGPSAITSGRVTLYPIDLNLRGYEMVFGDPKIWRAYANTILYAVVGTFLNLLFTSMVSYALMVRDFVFRKFLTVFFTITMFFSGGMVPSYILIQNLNLMDTMWAIILPSCVSAYNVFIYRAFFKSISNEIREAAFVDGAGDIRILFQIYLPLSKALLATFGLFAIVGYWNMWFEPLLYLKDNNKQPIQMILRQILFTSGTAGMSGAQEMVNLNLINPKNIQYACIIATIGPVLLVYPFLQKYFEKGMMIGAVKG
ncbi:MAG: putative aldouronate transport system permease protein [Clostridiales bacterium]|jgi:putative aldouronate transport system permease protein|nr:putative aldouronate transport system permease protein [Clostridiales bacterium]